MRWALTVAIALMIFVASSGAFARPKTNYCATDWFACAKKCTKDNTKKIDQDLCIGKCDFKYNICLKRPSAGNNPHSGAGTIAAPFSAPAMTSGAKNVNSGTAATATIKGGMAGATAINPGTAATTTINAAPLSAPAKPPTTVSNEKPGHAPNGQSGRSNFHVQ